MNLYKMIPKVDQLLENDVINKLLKNNSKNLVMESIHEELNNIRNKILLDIKNETDLTDFKVFTVSNTTYKKGLKNNKNKLIEHSGIKLLHEYIDSFVKSSKSEIQDRICERIDLETEKITRKLELLKDERTKNLKKQEKDINEFKSRINDILSSRFCIIERANDRLNRCMDEITSLKS